ncbi:MAG: tetratricopeptide repeat protein [Planctomycetota bacterium]|nr:tetratricopeptide repeat protein [Planctomycetota bacterium]
MRTTKLILLGVLFGCGWIGGCASSQPPKGLHAHRPLGSLGAGSHSFAAEKERSGLQGFFAAVSRGNRKNSGGSRQLNPHGIPPERDPTSLRSQPTVSVELLIVAGEMGLKQHQFESAANYFRRALQMDPQNQRANAGLAQAKAGSGTPAQSASLPALQRESRRDSAPGLLDRAEMLDEKSVAGVQQVTYHELAEASGKPLQHPVSNYQDSFEITNPIARPEIDFHQWSSSQRITNPFFRSPALPGKFQPLETTRIREAAAMHPSVRLAADAD